MRAYEDHGVCARQRDTAQPSFLTPGFLRHDVALVVSHVWFQFTSLEHFSSGSWTYFSPFPLGVIDVVTEPMTGP